MNQLIPGGEHFNNKLRNVIVEDIFLSFIMGFNNTVVVIFLPTTWDTLVQLLMKLNSDIIIIIIYFTMNGSTKRTNGK